MPRLSDRVGTFTDSVIRRMTRINNQYDSINLSQGFPDFDPPKELTDALAKAAHDGPHQYAVTFGAQNFREALAKKTSPALHHEVDPNTEICVTCGGTEAMMAAMMTICNPGDKVMVFSPFYENYGADAILSGAEPIYIPLVPPEYEFDLSLIEKGFAEGARKVHDFLTVGAAAPLQEAAVAGLTMPASYYEGLRALYTEKRDHFLAGLDAIGLKHNVPQGTYFVMIDISDFLSLPQFKGWTDLEFCEWMIKNIGVAAVPGSSFFKEPVNHLIRMHFARGTDVLDEAVRRLAKLTELLKYSSLRF